MADTRSTVLRVDRWASRAHIAKAKAKADADSSVATTITHPPNPLLNRPPRASQSARHSTRTKASSISTLPSSHYSPSHKSRPYAWDAENRHDSMLSTPLPDYRHTANQTNRSRAAYAARANRALSSTSGNSAERRQTRTPACGIAFCERRAAWSYRQSFQHFWLGPHGGNI